VSQSPADPADPLARLAAIHYARSDMNDVLLTIARLAREVVTPAREVSVTLMSQDKATTAAFTGQLAIAMDEQQYEQGYGPCLEACISGEILIVLDTANERRWPSFARRAAELGIRSSLSVPMPIQDVVSGAMNFYAVTPRAFDDAATGAATTFAEHAAVAVANARSYESAATLIERMRLAARSRSLIEQAKGVLMGRFARSSEQALNILILAAREADRRLGDVAGALVAGAQPGDVTAAEGEILAVLERVRLHEEPGEG
jgi:GAF domain-containing protein